MKQLLRALLCLVLSLGILVLPALAEERDQTSYTEITGLSEDFGWGGYSTNGGEVEKFTSLHDWAYLQGIRPGNTYFLPLTRKDFEWEDDKGAPITMRTIEELGITLEKEDPKGNHLIQFIGFAQQNGQTGIKVVFRDTMVSLEQEEFEVNVDLLVDGVAYKGSSFKIRGTIANRTMMVKSGDTQCTLGHGRYAQSYDTVTGVRFHLGQGVSIVSNIDVNEKFYGAVTVKSESTDEAALAQYPQIKKVLKLETIGLRGNVEFDTGDEGIYYVYDDTLVYLGTTNQSVPYRNKYYLASSKLG